MPKIAFKERLASLGFSNYTDYLNGEHWKDFKTAYKQSNRKQQCAICKSRVIQLHHHNYDNIGNESFDDITPLCREHHEIVHYKLKEAKRSIRHTEWAIQELTRNIKKEEQRKPLTEEQRVSQEDRRKQRLEKKHKRKDAMRAAKEIEKARKLQKQIKHKGEIKDRDRKISKYNQSDLSDVSRELRILALGIHRPLRPNQKKKNKKKERLANYSRNHKPKISLHISEVIIPALHKQGRTLAQIAAEVGWPQLRIRNILKKIERSATLHNSY